MITLEQFVFFLIVSFKIENKIIKFLDHELILFKTFISDVEDRVLVCWLVVHIEDNMSLRNGHDGSNISWTRFYPILPYWNVHVSCVSF